MWSYIPPQTFESTLKEVVQAKRLSSSKMEKLKDIALKCMENDTQLVSILYRRHKGLSNTAKIHSLYAFDALARAARHQVVKRGLTGDINSERGNCATFLLKVEGVLEGLFQNMLSSGSTEAKEKTQKILDIWTKSSTFQKTVLERLQEVVNNSDKGAYHDSIHVFAKYFISSVQSHLDFARNTASNT
ncbi:hypothetical protein PLICRDRAFT_113018 [Plicaturopsis crispa FD-325 SS-3]|nr:hypothetical protein PLICRDRAFT_113018 [Plicaturopsis crispa FD-325 SS-3]